MTYTPEQIARVVHEANRALQTVQADPTIPVSPSWDDLDAETRASAVDGVRGVASGGDARASHENWMRFKLAHGWTLGPVKDEAAKQHPLLVLYDDLPAAQQDKDHLFAAVVRALIPMSDDVVSRAEYDRVWGVAHKYEAERDEHQENAARLLAGEEPRYVLMCPHGMRVEGLPVDEAVRVIRSLCGKCSTS
jgi:hypothetical protein